MALKSGTSLFVDEVDGSKVLDLVCDLEEMRVHGHDGRVAGATEAGHDDAAL